MDKTFIGNVKTHTFQNGGKIFKIGIKVEDLQKHIKKGWINLIMAERREPKDPTKTHYMYVDTYEARQNTEEDNIPF